MVYYDDWLGLKRGREGERERERRQRERERENDMDVVISMMPHQESSGVPYRKRIGWKAKRE